MSANNDRLSIRAGLAIHEGARSELVSQAKQLVGFHCTKFFGGCSVMEGRGFWSPQGDNFQSEYGTPQEETLLWLNLMIMPDQLDEARNCIKQCGVLLREMGVAPDLRRIHCEVTGTRAHHITVDCSPAN